MPYGSIGRPAQDRQIYYPLWHHPNNDSKYFNRWGASVEVLSTTGHKDFSNPSSVASGIIGLTGTRQGQHVFNRHSASSLPFKCRWIHLWDSRWSAHRENANRLSSIIVPFVVFRNFCLQLFFPSFPFSENFTVIPTAAAAQGTISRYAPKMRTLLYQRATTGE